jgi:hypothetical protein
MKMYGGIAVIAPPFFTLALGGGEWSASRFGLFIPEKKRPVPTGCEAGMNAVKKRKDS